ncbi:hypothetical protein, partial [Nocardia uniformis]
MSSVDRQIQRPDEFLEAEILCGIVDVGDECAGHIVSGIPPAVLDEVLQQPDHLLVVGDGFRFA